ncbi:MAG TPA: hypothetical protein DDW52_18540 [Planctomycetaceae bacterium]|nr:hypothetical protein [Planctomycetaceae bacterium]
MNINDSNTALPSSQSGIHFAVGNTPQCSAADWDLASLDAAWAGVYELDSIGFPAILTSVGEVDPITEQRVIQMVASSIQNEQSKLSSLTSPFPRMISVEPVPGAKRCVAAVYACDLTEVQETDVAGKLDILESFARSISDSAPSEPVREKSTREVQSATWRELFKPLLDKIRAEMETQRKRAHTYLAAAAVVAVICCIPLPFRVACKTRCEPTHCRFVAAPFDARLESTHAVIGQSVKAGDILATLDGGEIKSKLSGLKDKANQSEQRYRAALSTGDHSAAEQERLGLEQLNREIELLKQRKQTLEIRSPIDGIVVDGDLEHAQGTPLEIGQSLFEIASLDELVAELAVPERDIRFVRNDLQVWVTLKSMSGPAIPSRIHRLHLRSEIRDSESVFIAEAAIANTDGSIRPGMNGNSVIHVGYRPLAWMMLRRPWNRLRNWIGW